ncbi:MAG: hypothetical protein K2O66_01205 [Bacteroidales bacterium]|nr:hypothetical protein [Bacteroidales bacterium]MDE7071967.1 hypothetical protein [Bacteroidales bacterium]
MKTALPVSCLCLLVACKTLVPVTENENRERLEQARHNRIDSVLVYIRDSIRVHEKGDTVRIEHWRERFRERLRIRTDSVYIRDSIYKQVPVMIPYAPNAGQKFLMKTGGISLLLIAAGIAWFLLRLFLRRP